MDDTLRPGIQTSTDQRHEGASRSNRSEHQAPEPLNPLVTWSAVLVASVALWGGFGLAISSVVSALL
jgi:hypothetical protein